MAPRSDEPDRYADADRLLAFLFRIICFLMGAVVFTYMALFSASGEMVRLIFGLSGIGLMGPVAYEGVASTLRAWRGGNGR
jgi:hypothetical protein